MSTDVENKVVQMEFENEKFEQNVQTSMNTLSKLKKSLNFTGAEKGFDNISNSASRIDFSGLSSAIETVQLKFSALEFAGIRIFTHLVDTAYNAGRNIVRALTIDPVHTGFSEYELKMGSIQTIMSNTSDAGKTLDDVVKILDDLNTYSDKTIYNFAEMTRNIGTFTSAGVGLEESAVAIKGIANLAAESGSTSQQASNAMYQLSQALASGKVQLMDWNSVVNAGMGGRKFRTAILQTAKEHGAAVDDIIKDQGKFRDSLRSGWLTSEILIDTLRKYTVEGAKEYSAEMVKTGKWTQEQADALIKTAQNAEDAATKVKTLSQLWDTLKEAAQSGWAQSWEIISGDFEEAKELYTHISDVIGAMVNESAAARNKMLSEWKEGGGRTAIIEGFTNIFNFVLKAIKPVKQAFANIFPPMTSKNLIDMSNSFLEFTKKLTISTRNFTNIKRIFQGVFSVIHMAIKPFKDLANAIKPLLGILPGVGNGFLDNAAELGGFLVRLDKATDKFHIFTDAANYLKDGLNILKSNFKNISPELKSAYNSIKDFVTNTVKTVSSFIKDIAGSLLSINWATLSTGFMAAFGGIWAVLKEASGVAIKGIGKALEYIIEVLSNINFERILGLFNTSVLTGISTTIYKFVKSLTGSGKNLKESFSGIKDILDEVRGCFESFQDKLKAESLKPIATSIAILTGSLLILSSIDADDLTNAVISISALFANLIGSMKIISNFPVKATAFAKVVPALIGMSIAVFLLATALKKVSTLTTDELITGISAVGLLSIAVVEMAKKVSFNSKHMISGSVGMYVIAKAINSMAKACLMFSTLSWEQIAKGLVSVGALLSGIGLFITYTKFSKGILSASVGMIMISTSIAIMGTSVSKLGNLSWDQIEKGIISLGLMLTELATFSYAMGKSKHVISTGLSMIMLSGALVVLAKALKMFGDLSNEEMSNGLFSLGVALTEVSIALNLMNGTLSGAAALLVLTGALGIMVPILKSLGNMKGPEIGKSLLMLASVFTIFGVAGYALAPVAPVLMTISGALAVFSLSVVGFGVGLTAIGAGLAFVAGGITSLGVAIASAPTSFIVGLTAIISAIASLIPMIIAKIGEGIVAFAKVIGGSALAIGGAIRDVVFGIMIVLREAVPDIVEGAITMINEVLKQVVKYIPSITENAILFVLGFVDAITKSLPLVIESASNLIMTFISGLILKLPDIVNAAFEIIITFIDGLATAIDNNAERLIAAIINLFGSVIKAAISVISVSIDTFKETASDIMNSGFIKGIKDKMDAARDAFWDLVDHIIESLKQKWEDFKNAGKNFVDGFIQGIKDKWEDTKDAISTFGSNIIEGLKNALDIHSPSKASAKIAEFFGDGFILKLKDMRKRMYNAAGKLGEYAKNGLFDATSNIMQEAIDIMTLDPVITPRVDLTNVDAALRKINAITTKDKAIRISQNDYLADAIRNSNPSQNEVSYNFTQNNYSPRALSRVEIYRQTHNQLSMLRGLKR